MSRHPGTAPTLVPPRVLLAPAEVVDRLHATRARARQAAVEELDLAVEWALLHPCPPNEEPAQWSEGRLFAERVVPLAGPGAPLVAEFAPAALAAALGISYDAGRQLLADALELTYRLPRLDDLVHAGVVPAYVARTISRDTHDLSFDAARHADRLVCAVPDKIGQVWARRLIDEARLWHDPDRAVEAERQALEARHVTVGRTGCPATREMHLLLDRQDAEALDHTLTELASRLSDLGDPDPLDLRRARAVGILADPQQALDLLRGPVDQETRRRIEDGRRTPVRPGGAAQIFVHVTPEDLAEHVEAGTGSAVVERLGAVSLDLLEAWLEGRRTSIRPVLDLTSPHTQAPIDRHDATPVMREHVIQRDATCVFPGCRRDSRSCDLDHIDPWIPPEEGGPPGQTRLDNLAPLCRTHHRVKTFTDWDYRRRPDGTHAWTSPTGHHYDVAAAPRHSPV
jgi:hypothetical protein